MELMIAVAIMGILAAIALPNYREYVTRSRIIDATKNLSDFRVRMEQYFLDNRTYVGGGGGCGVPDPTLTGSESFKITCTNAAARTYTVTATGISGKMDNFSYTIDQSNVQATTNVPSGWSKNAACWVLRKDGTCA